jgi:hypothetical protein
MSLQTTQLDLMTAAAAETMMMITTTMTTMTGSQMIGKHQQVRP